MAFTGNCFRCEMPGHVAADCAELKPAQDRKDHDDRIKRYVERWTNGEITLQQKRKFIEMENRMWQKELASK